MRNCLSPVDQHRDVPAVRCVDDLAHRVDGSEGIRDVAHGDELGSPVQQLFKLVELHLAAVIDGNDTQHRLLLLAKHLPGHDVRVMLQGRNDDLISSADVRSSIGLRYQVNPFRRAADEDDLPRISRVQKPLHLAPRRFIRLGGPFTQLMHAPVDIGVVHQVEMRERLNDAFRLLARRRVVKIDERLAMHLLRENRKLLPNGAHIEASYGWHATSPRQSFPNGRAAAPP